LISWLEAKGTDYDIVTDQELHDEGVAAIAGYAAVTTGSHPEYHTSETLDALTDYRDQGGKFLYLGGNGFYWRVALHESERGAIEIRRAEGGIRAWAAEPGEYYNAFDGAYGGLWRRSGRPPQKLAGIGFSAQGQFEGSYYRRNRTAENPSSEWVFAGIDDDILGDFGLSGGGAAGFELDRVDYRLGSPENIQVLASSEGHGDAFVLVPEEQLTHITNWPGEPVEHLLRADMIYFELPNGGAVFATGSITFCGSLPHNNFDNNISTLLGNVLNRFLKGS
jgi:N,N-dimethylformamidase